MTAEVNVERASKTPLEKRDPMEIFRSWQAEACTAKDPMRDLFVLATTDHSGRPSARILSYRPGSAGEFRFFTHHRSRKGRELSYNPNVAALFYWHDGGRQVRLEGNVGHVEAAVSDAYFMARPLAHQVATLLSPQSQPLHSLSLLRQSHRHAVERIKQGEPFPQRSPWWGGYELHPMRIELWQRGAFRLHERHRFDRVDSGWVHRLLCP